MMKHILKGKEGVKEIEKQEERSEIHLNERLIRLDSLIEKIRLKIVELETNCPQQG